MKSRHTFKAFFIKSIFYAIFAIIITCIIVGIYSFNSINGYINQIMENKLIDVAISSAAFLNNEPELFELQAGDEYTDVYQRCLKKLKEIRDTTDIKYIYVLKKDMSGTTVFVIDADEEVANPIGLEYIADDIEYRNITFSGQYTVSEGTYGSGFGELISCYAPIKDNSGNVIAILGVDYSLDTLNADIRKTFRIYLMICAAVTIVIVLLFMFLSNFGYQRTKKLLSGSISEIKNISAEVDNFSKELRRGNVTLSDNTSSSLAAIDGMSATMDETSSMIKQNNNNTQKATEYFKKSALEIQSSTEKMKELDAGMAGIKESSDEIQKIIEVINNIAKQTKILALNAEVEAARVGEAGKGFSIVAKEVGDLAMSSENAARDINAIITNNIMLTQKAVTDSVSVNKAMIAVNQRLNDFSLIINELSMAGVEQEKGLHHLVNASDMIKQAVTSNADLANEIKISANTLSNMTDDLNHNVNSIEKIMGTQV